VDVESKKHVTSNKQLHVGLFNITKFCAMTQWGRKKQGMHNGVAFWPI